MHSCPKSAVQSLLPKSQVLHDWYFDLSRSISNLRCLATGMVTVWKPSGDTLDVIPLEEVGNVGTLKQYLKNICGLPRFRQCILREGNVLEDGFTFDSPIDVQLVLLTFSDASEMEVLELMQATQYGAVGTVEMILRRPQDPNLPAKDGDLPLNQAAFYGHKDVMMLLLEAKANLCKAGADDESALHCAAGRGMLDIAQLLLEEGASKDCRDSEGFTPLLRAANECNTEIVRLLTDWRASVNIPSNTGHAALMCASAWNSPEVVHMLLEASAALDCADCQGCTALHHASQNGHTQLALTLLETRAMLGLKDNEGATALHSACANGYAETASMLLEAKAALDVLDNSGYTALSRALVQGPQSEILRILLRARALPKHKGPVNTRWFGLPTLTYDEPQLHICGNMLVGSVDSGLPSVLLLR